MEDTSDLYKLIHKRLHFERDIIMLAEALEEKKYQKIYALLRKRKNPFTDEEAFCLCNAALGCTYRVMERLLERCPSIREFQFYKPFESLLTTCIWKGRADLLELFLKNGASPNNPPNWTKNSPLEEAFAQMRLGMMMLLLQEPELDCTMTQTMLRIWAKMYDEEDMLARWCCEALAPRFLGEDGSFFEVFPLPPQLTMADAAEVGNVDLMLRLCREKPLNEADAQTLLIFFEDFIITNQEDEKELMKMLLQQYPKYLRELYCRISSERMAALLAELPQSVDYAL